MKNLAFARVWLIFCGLGLAVSCARGQEMYLATIDTKQLDATLRTDWYGVYLKTDKIGYVKATRSKTPEGNYKEAVDFSIKLVSFGQKTEMAVHQWSIFSGKEPFDFLKGELVQKGGPLDTKHSFQRNADGGIEVLYQTGNQSRKSTVKNVKYSLRNALASESWIRQGPKLGDTIRYESFDLSDQKMDVMQSKIVGVKQSLVNGVPLKFYETENKSKLKGITTLSRHDETGDLLSDVILVFELRKESEAQAKNTTFSQDLFVMGKAKIDQGIGDTSKVAELVLQTENKGDLGLFDGPRQTVVKQADGTTVIKLGKIHGKATKATEAEIKENLEETDKFPFTHPKIQELAKEAVGDAGTPEEKVKRIVRYVKRFIIPSLSVAVPNIHHLMEKKKGDCKSYALLTVNLMRAAGIPAREISGLVYMGDEVKAFGGHAWNEVVLNGEWVPLDATLGQVELDAGHISFGTEDRATNTLFSSLGNLSFRVLSSKKRD